MANTLFFYDLETSGLSASNDRIMQFAGQRTDLDLKPIGKPVNHLIRLTEDILPSPEAILLTGITPQQTIAEGLTEAEFLKLFYSEVAIPNTIFVGFNNVRFDDEFMRYLNYRNFYDPYEWHWSEGRSRWDFMDVVRMTRALRPEGIKWPNDSTGKPSNKLELITKANKIEHSGAHDALSDVSALIELAKLLKTSQPKLFGFLFEMMRDKTKLSDLIGSGQPFVYTSGKYSSDYVKTAVVASLVSHPKRDGALVFDLRFDPEEYSDLSVEDLLNLWLNKEEPHLPVQTIFYNRLPAVAPMGVFDKPSQERLNLSSEDVETNYKKLQRSKSDFGEKMLQVVDKLDKQQTGFTKDIDVDERLYEGFINPLDKKYMKEIVSIGSDGLAKFEPKFKDDRLNALLPLYKARNYPKTLSSDEVAKWDEFKKRRLLEGKENSRAGHFFNQISALSSKPKLTSQESYILEELRLYAESIIPVD